MRPGRYEAFLAEHGAKSGVGHALAMQSGVDLGAYRRVAAAGELDGVLALKVWDNSRAPAVLWAHLDCGAGRVCFPLFGRRANPVAAFFMDAPLGSRVSASFRSTKGGRARCVEARYCQPL